MTKPFLSVKTTIDMAQKVKTLLIRFSSFGDVTQCLSVAAKLKEKFPQSELHWIVREDLAVLLENHPEIDRIIRFPRRLGLKGLIRLSQTLRTENYTHIYDAHNNLRSRIIAWILRPGTEIKFLRKSQKRLWRFLLFQWRINLYPQPFSGQRDLIEPLKAWGIDSQLPKTPQIFTTTLTDKKAEDVLGDFKNAIALAPSAAFVLKRWPMEYWRRLISILPNEKFVLLGGPEDDFLKYIAAGSPHRVLNLAGKTDLTTSAAVVKLCKALVSNDTGPLHLAEQQGKNCIALMGPAPFGFPSRSTTTVLQRNLSCRPCSKHGQGPCTNSKFQFCLRDISPEEVAQKLLVNGWI